MNSIRYSGGTDTAEAAVIRAAGVGILNARSEEQIMSSCGFTDRKQLAAAVAAAWAHGVRILQYHGKYFVAANSKEFEYYLPRQSNAAGDPVVEYR